MGPLRLDRKQSGLKISLEFAGGEIALWRVSVSTARPFHVGRWSSASGWTEDATGLGRVHNRNPT